jgi:cytochrome c oxidase assembly protein subunit 11
MSAAPSPSSNKGVARTAFACLALAVAMVGAAYAAVPLYDLFCKATGYDGTPLVGTAGASRVLDRKVYVRFDTNVSPALGWSFVPDQPEVVARVGETQTVFFRVRNEGERPTTGVAAYNVQPGQAGAFFVKLQCFCFEEQTLAAGETMDFPVVFYVDPSLADDRNLDGLTSITLSYTYFPSRNGQPVAASGNGAGRPKS